MKKRILLIGSIIAGGVLMYVFSRGTISMPVVAVFVLVPIMALLGRWRTERQLGIPAYGKANRSGTGEEGPNTALRADLETGSAADVESTPETHSDLQADK